MQMDAFIYLRAIYTFLLTKKIIEKEFAVAQSYRSHLKKS